MTAPNALVFCGGGPSRIPLPALDAPIIVAADAGVVEAQRLGLRVDLLIGDLDSAPTDTAGRIARAGGRVERHPTDKDASDLELALEAVRRLGATSVLVVGGDAGRLDHLVGTALLLAAPRLADLTVDAVLGAARLHVVRGRRVLDGAPGELVSLFALGGAARGIRTSGLRWRLDGEELQPGSTRGLSNEFEAARAAVEVAEGVLVAIRPGTAGSGGPA